MKHKPINFDKLNEIADQSNKAKVHCETCDSEDALEEKYGLEDVDCLHCGIKEIWQCKKCKDITIY